MSNTKNIIRDHYIEKGFLNVRIDISEKEDPDSKKHVLLIIDVNKGEKQNDIREI
mgnify:CR=1 FL=1